MTVPEDENLAAKIERLRFSIFALRMLVAASLLVGVATLTLVFFGAAR